jgi:hypothetical protein
VKVGVAFLAAFSSSILDECNYYCRKTNYYRSARINDEARESALNLPYRNGVYSTVAKNTMLLLYCFQDEIANIQ